MASPVPAMATSPCNALPQPQFDAAPISCPVPWMQPSERFFYNTQAGSCQSFQYPGCGNFGGNQFGSYNDCVNSCQSSSSMCGNDGGCLPSLDYGGMISAEILCNVSFALSHSIKYLAVTFHFSFKVLQ